MKELDIRHRCGIAIVWGEESGWKIEGAMKYSPNVVSFRITAGWKKWFAIRKYIPPNYQPTENQLEQSLVLCME